MIISDFFNVLLSSGLTIFIIIIILAILIASYEKASPNEVLIITGGCLGKKGPYLIEDPETHTRVKDPLRYNGRGSVDLRVNYHRLKSMACSSQA